MLFWLLITSILLQSLQALPQQQAEHEELTETQKFIEYIMETFGSLTNHTVQEAEIVIDKVIDELDTKYADNVAVQQRVAVLKCFSEDVKTSNKQDIATTIKLYIEYDRLSRRLNATRLENPSEADHIVYDALKKNGLGQVKVNYEKESDDYWEEFTKRFPKFVDGQPEDQKKKLNEWYSDAQTSSKSGSKLLSVSNLPNLLDKEYFQSRYDLH